MNSVASKRWSLPAQGAVLLGETLLAALVFFALDGLAHQRLDLREIGACAAAWPAGSLVSKWFVRRWSMLSGKRLVVEILAGGICLVLASRWGGSGLTFSQISYAVMLMAALAVVWRGLLGRVVKREENVWGEAARLIVAGGIGVWVTFPFFTNVLVGGVDARWYSYMLADFIEQWRLGKISMIIGQGEFAYNGGVHPFRTAPFFQYWAGLWDLATLRSLNPLALQHLAAISSAFFGSLGMYLVLTALAPTRRWLAMTVAAIYMTSPAFLGVIYGAEAYMTFMAVGVLPLVVYGNMRLIQQQPKGWVWLSIGLALLWNCHAGVALFCTLSTALIQGARFLLEEQPAREWWSAVGSGVLFLLLGCYYFTGLLELPRSIQAPIFPTAVQLLGAGLALTGIVRGVVWGRRKALGWLVAGLLMLLWARPAWMTVLALTALLSGAVSTWARRRSWFESRTHTWPVVAGSLLVSGILVPLLAGEKFRVPYPDIVDRLNAYRDRMPGMFLPLIDHVGVYQPGFAVAVLLLLVVWGATWGKSGRARLVVIPLILLVISCRPIPVVSAFWVAHFPALLMEISDFPVDYRLLPPLVALTCGAAFLWIADLGENRRGAYRALVVLTFLLAAWSCFLTWPFLRIGISSTAARPQSDRQFRSENIHLDRFAYDRMFIPKYFSDGKTDVRLESRLLDPVKWLAVGPDETARTMEALEKEERLLKTSVEPANPTWLNLAPSLTLVPGEHVLLRFEFLPKAYNGWLTLSSQNIYREYFLPDSGWIKAFGVGVGRSKVISLWNSGKTDEQINFVFKRVGLEANAENFGDFAKLTISHYRPEVAPIKMQSLIPYRVTASVAKMGWLETPRLYLPGYVATIDGNRVPVQTSPDRLAMIPVTKGSHVVEMVFEGSTRLRAAWWISSMAWIGVGLWAFASWRNRGPANVATG